MLPPPHQPPAISPAPRRVGPHLPPGSTLGAPPGPAAPIYRCSVPAQSHRCCCCCCQWAPGDGPPSGRSAPRRAPHEVSAPPPLRAASQLCTSRSPSRSLTGQSRSASTLGLGVGLGVGVGLGLGLWLGLQVALGEHARGRGRDRVRVMARVRVRVGDRVRARVILRRHLRGGTAPGGKQAAWARVAGSLTTADATPL